jgi:hypothetical protein
VNHPNADEQEDGSLPLSHITSISENPPTDTSELPATNKGTESRCNLSLSKCRSEVQGCIQSFMILEDLPISK